MNDLTLVVMAAGMGSRFGGLKQITPVDDDGSDMRPGRRRNYGGILAVRRLDSPLLQTFVRKDAAYRTLVRQS